MKNFIFYMGGNFKFYCLQLEYSVGISKDFVFPNWDESLALFSDGDNFHDFSHRDEFLADFPSGWWSHRVCEKGVF